MLTDAQIAARKIGGSDIGIILGMNPYVTPTDLYRQKIGEVPPFEGNEHTQAGEVMEGAIADLYTLRTGRRVRRSNITHAHPVHDFLTANIDREVVGERRIVEIKNVGRHAAKQWGEPGTDEAPPWYLMQAHHYMLVLDYPAADIVAYFGGGDLGVYPVERSADMDAIIIDAARTFWQCVQTKTPPPFDPNHPAALDCLARLYPGTNGETVAGDDRLLAWTTVERDASEALARYEKIKDGARAHLLSAMGEASILTLPDGSKWERKTVARKGFTVEATEYTQLKWSKPK